VYTGEDCTHPHHHLRGTTMSTVIVTGYYGEGVAYAMHLDDTIADPDRLTGVIEDGPNPLISRIEAATGETGRTTPVGDMGGTISLGSIEGVLAYLTSETEIVSITGDLPAKMTQGEDVAPSPARVAIDY
jgi:hypothetical protein